MWETLAFEIQQCLCCISFVLGSWKFQVPWSWNALPSPSSDSESQRNRNNSIFRIQYGCTVHQQNINSSKICSLALMFVFVSINSVVHTILSNPFNLFVDMKLWHYLLFDFIASNGRVHLAYLTSVLEHGPLGGKVIPSSNIWLPR